VGQSKVSIGANGLIPASRLIGNYTKHGFVDGCLQAIAPAIMRERREFMSREQKVAAVEAYLDCFVTKDLSKVPFAEDVTFEGPRMPKLTGRPAVIGFLTHILPMVKGIQLKQHIVEGDYVATVFDMETVNGVDHVCDLIHIADGRIEAIQAFYYPGEIPNSQTS
jgi:hypothetical protein